jgi:glycosyltransferase involved in cell wall biosynthesis
VGQGILGTLSSHVNYPRISIVIPSFNQDKYLEQAILSVLSQGYPNLELIVIDGGSRDFSLDVIQKYSGQLAYWVSEPDRGQSHAINKGLRHCTGEIVTFLSSDDYYLPGVFFDVSDHYLHNTRVGAIIGGFSFLDAGRVQPDEPISPFLDGSSPVDLTLGPPGKYRLHQVSTFYIRSALSSVGQYVREDMRYVMDRELLYRVCRKYPIKLSEKTYGVFRRHPDSKSTADILPFAREFSDLYLMNLTGDLTQDRLRKKMSKYRLSRGYMKHAYTTNKNLVSIFFLIRAGIVCPEYFFQKGLWKCLLGVFSM